MDNFESEIDAAMMMKARQKPDNADKAFEDTIDHAMALRAHDTLPQQILTGFEGGAKGFLGPIATAAERGLHELGVPGISPEDQALREEASPWIHGGAEAATFVGGALTGAGLPGVLARSGKAISKTLQGAEAARRIAQGSAEIATAVAPLKAAKIGSDAVASIIENGIIFGGGNEISKFINEDPAQSVGSALANMTMLGVLGGGLTGGSAVISSLWKKTEGAQTTGILRAIADKLGGIEGEQADIVSDLINKSGVEVAPELRAAMQGNKEVQHQFNIAREAKNSTVINALDEVHTKAPEMMLNSLGKTPEEIANYSEAKQGRAALDTFKKEYSEIYEPISKEYSEVTSKFDNVELPKAQIIERELPVNPSPYAQEYTPKIELEKIPSAADILGEKVSKIDTLSDERPVIDMVLKRLPEAKTVQDISEISSKVHELTWHRSDLWHVGRTVKQTLLDGQQDILEKMIGEESPELFSRYMAVRKEYARVARIRDELSNNLSLGKTEGSQGFLARLAEKRSPEEFIKKLSPRGNAEILPFLAEHFPETLNKIKDNELMELIRPAFLRAGKGQAINPKVLTYALDKASPEVKNFVLPAESLERINAANALLEMIPEFKSSGTGGWIKSLFSQVPATAGALASVLLGHGALSGYALGHLAKLGAREGPDALRVMLLKWLGSNKPIDSAAFKAGLDFINNTIKGENLIKGSAKAIFNAGSKVIPEHLIANDEQLDRLDTKLKEVGLSPGYLDKMGNKTGYYMEPQGTAIYSQVAQVAGYVNSQRPKPMKGAPLDPEIKPTKGQQEAFKQVLRIAQQPLVVMSYLKKGTLTQQDMQHLTSMYPAVYQNLKLKLTSEMIDYLSEGKTVPYQSRFGLSLFFGQPMDSSFSPQSVLSNQQVFSQVEAEEQAKQPKQQRPSQAGLQKLKPSTRLTLMPSDSGR